jgi:hypothetical protein
MFAFISFDFLPRYIQQCLAIINLISRTTNLVAIYYAIHSRLKSTAVYQSQLQYSQL